MGMYVSIRGWLEVDHKHREAVEGIIEAASRDLYSGGWGFPAKPFNWSLYVFYGGDIREAEVPWLLGQVSQIAALPPADDDGDLAVGMFLLTDERGGVTAWEVRDGTVRERPAPEFRWMLR